MKTLEITLIIATVVTEHIGLPVLERKVLHNNNHSFYSVSKASYVYFPNFFFRQFLQLF